MKQYFHFFRFVFIGIAVLILVLGAVSAGKAAIGSLGIGERTNTECLTEERVFDYADKLTDKEEAKLRKLIAKREKQIGCDIVLVTLEESLEEYVKPYEEQLGYIYVDEYTTVYADNFYDEHKYGYDVPYGDGAILVDNYAREYDGLRYAAFSTCGKVEYKYSDAMIDHMFDRIFAYEKLGPYAAYKTYINTLYHDMSGMLQFTAYWSLPAILMLSVVVMAIFVLINLIPSKGKKTTTIKTYVADNSMKMNQQSDVFLTKTVTKRRIETSSSSGGGGRSGGGGHHRSSSGRSHGGGSRGR
ncbi:MAG: TPM domain-containing protein [Lachnospiraceae bacterium]|nr:TPM domain-containing protein [Lachnospiraceae bacterium]